MLDILATEQRMVTALQDLINPSPDHDAAEVLRICRITEFQDFVAQHGAVRTTGDVMRDTVLFVRLIGFEMAMRLWLGETGAGLAKRARVKRQDEALGNIIDEHGNRDILDYSKPLLQLERAARDCYEALEQDKDLSAARDKVNIALEALIQLDCWLERAERLAA